MTTDPNIVLASAALLMALVLLAVAVFAGPSTRDK